MPASLNISFSAMNPEDTYHIEFVYGSDLTELQKYTAGKYAYWQGAGIPENADEKLIENCIKLYCVENAMSETRSMASIAQVADLVGTWDISLDDGKTADYSLQHFTVDKNGNPGAQVDLFGNVQVEPLADGKTYDTLTLQVSESGKGLALIVDGKEVLLTQGNKVQIGDPDADRYATVTVGADGNGGHQNRFYSEC